MLLGLRAISSLAALKVKSEQLHDCFVKACERGWIEILSQNVNFWLWGAHACLLNARPCRPTPFRMSYFWPKVIYQPLKRLFPLGADCSLLDNIRHPLHLTSKTSWAQRNPNLFSPNRYASMKCSRTNKVRIWKHLNAIKHVLAGKCGQMSSAGWPLGRSARPVILLDSQCLMRPSTFKQSLCMMLCDLKSLPGHIWLADA